MSQSDRFRPQRRLPEVGASGQAKLEAAHFSVAGEGASIEQSYLERAGATVAPGSSDHFDCISPGHFVHEGYFRFPETRAIAAGAWRALTKIKSALEIPS